MQRCCYGRATNHKPSSRRPGVLLQGACHAFRGVRRAAVTASLPTHCTVGRLRDHHSPHLVEAYPLPTVVPDMPLPGLSVRPPQVLPRHPSRTHSRTRDADPRYAAHETVELDARRDFPRAFTERRSGNAMRYIAYLCNAHPRARPKRYIPYVAPLLRGHRAWAGCPSLSPDGPSVVRYIAHLCNAHGRARSKRYIPYVATALRVNRASAGCPSLSAGGTGAVRYIASLCNAHH